MEKKEKKYKHQFKLDQTYAYILFTTSHSRYLEHLGKKTV